MSESLRAAADVLRAEIRSDARRYARALTAFAERFAIDPELRDRGARFGRICLGNGCIALLRIKQPPALVLGRS